jgi:hypothetical protein
MANVTGLTVAGATLQAGAAAVANGSFMDTGGLGVVALSVSGTFVATIQPQVQTDELNWVNAVAINVATGAVYSTITTTGVYLICVAGASQCRAQITCPTFPGSSPGPNSATWPAR